jgi:hypothetical protein
MERSLIIARTLATRPCSWGRKKLLCLSFGVEERPWRDDARQCLRHLYMASGKANLLTKA